MKHTLAILLMTAAPAFAGNALSYEPDPLPPLTPAERVTSFAGPYIGVSVGYAQTDYEWSRFVQRKIYEDQCWKFYNDDWSHQIPDSYCDTPPTGDNAHWLKHAEIREDVFVGVEHYEEHGTETDEQIAYSIYAGSRAEVFTNIYAGIELEHTFLTTRHYDGITELKAVAGVGIGSVMPYIYAGYAWTDGPESVSYGAGVEWQMTNTLSLRAEYSEYPDLGTDIVSVGMQWGF